MKSLLLVLAVVLVGCEHKRAKGPFSSTWENLRNGRSTKRSTPTKTNDRLRLNDDTALPKSLGNLILHAGGWRQLVADGWLNRQRTKLELYNNQLTDVKGLEQFTKLTRLYLDRNQLTFVKGLEKLTQLTELRLSGNQLTDVKGLEKLTQLKMLFLSGNQLTDVKDLEKLTQLDVLDLKDNQLTSVKGLEKLTQLRLLYLQDNPDLTKAQIDELQKALPKLGIRSIHAGTP